MSTLTQTTTTSVTSLQKNRQILASVLLGLIVLSIVGFAPIEVIHNAAHDTRHSSGFPCH
ncbi:MAG: CbtB-domain containing protein [Methylococcales bacterium]|nr:CbtB-domain containing protein [Methylococcales bacterium]